MIVTAKDLRFKIAKIFQHLSQGEEIIITYRGKAKAKLIGINEKSEKADIAFGMWSDREESVEKIARELRKERNFDL